MSQWNDPQGRPRQDQPTARFGNDPYQQPPVQAPRGYGQPAQNPFGTEGNDEFGIVGMVFALLGGVLLIVCFTALDWFKNSVSFGDVGDALDRVPSATGFASAYFSWFAWVFFVVALLAAIGSSFPSPALRALRVLGVVTAFAAAGLSFLAVQLTDDQSYVDYLKQARVGFYLAVIGFVLVGIGAAIGPRKV